MKRIFIAIAASPQMRENIREFREDHHELPIRWHADKNLHITLVPPAELSDTDLQKMVSQLNSVSLEKPFEVHFDKIAFGKASHASRQMWATGQAPAELHRLKEQIEQAINYKPDRPFMMHITLGRYKPEEITGLPEEITEANIHWTMLVDNFVIMESHLYPTGADYTILHRFNFQK